jgi:carotenoid cleavage dioxygenase-like enzyme
MADPFAFFHTINAFEDRNQLVVDICCYPDGQVVHALFSERIKTSRDPQNNDRFNSEAKSEVRRYVLPLIDRMTDVRNIHFKNNFAITLSSLNV